MSRLVRFLSLLLLVAWGAVPASGHAGGDVRIGVLAKRGDERTQSRWQPTADYLGEQIPGYHFKIVPLGFHEIGEAVADRKVDFVLTNSGIYVDFEIRYGVGRIATMQNRNGSVGYTRFGGVIFTRAQRHDINTVRDLAGKRFYAVDENSFGGYLAAWREMQQAGVRPNKDTQLYFAGTHDAVVEAVLNGVADAGTVRTDTLERMRNEGKIKLADIKILNPQHHVGFGYLCSTRLYPEWPFAKLAHTPDDLSDAVASALLRMSPDSPAARSGLVSGWTVPRNYQPVHALMRELHLGPYERHGRITFRDLIRNYWHWVLLTLLAILLLSITTGYVTRLNVRLRKAEGELIEARDHLADKVRERTAELERSHRRLERISRDWNDAFDAISDPIFIHDSDMRIVQANPAYCERAGYSLEEMLGQPYYLFFPRMERPMRSCQEFPEQLHTEGDELVLDSGEVFVSRSFGIQRFDNTVKHALHILEDVTAVRRAEARRRTLSRAVEQAGEGIIILDRDKALIYCNPGVGSLLEKSVSEDDCLPEAKGIEGLVEPHFVDALARMFEAASKGENASGEMELAVADGRSKPVFATVGGIHGEDGELKGYVLTLLDLSEIKQAEQALTYRIGFESVIAGIASRLVNIDPERIEQEVTSALGMLGEFAKTDRVHLFSYDAAEDLIANTHEWCAPGAQPQKERLQKLSFAELPWIREAVLNNQVLRLDDVSMLPDEAGVERTEFIRQGIQSLLLVPLNSEGKITGFIAFDSVSEKREWEDVDVNLLHTAGEVIINTLARVQAQLKVQLSEASLSAAQQIAHLGNWDWDITSGTLEWSDEIYRIFGLSPQQFAATYEAFLESVHPDDREFVIAEVNKAVAGESSYDIDHRILRPDGSERIVHELGEVHFSDTGEAVRMIGTVQDVTELRQAERETQRLNRALRTLSLCNTTLVHAEKEEKLLDDICDILIKHGGYRFAWVGYAEQDEHKTIRPIASAGSGEGFLESLRITWADELHGQHPAGHAIRERATHIIRNIADDTDCYAPWREAAREHGYVSAIALPLISEGVLYGAITIDAGEADAFDQAELRLLEEMAGDMAFGIRTLRSRIQRQRMERALQKTEERYEELYENAPNAYVSISPQDGTLLQFNQALCDMLGYTRETLEKMTLSELLVAAHDEEQQGPTLHEQLMRGKRIRDAETQMRHADGRAVWVSVSVDPVKDDEGSLVENRAMVIDISARKQAEEDRTRFAEQLQRSLLQTIRAIAMTIEKRDPYTAGHQERVAELAVMIGREMGLDEQNLEGLKLGALIHDIGKISVPAEILNRPGKLEPEMFSIIRTHPQNGYEIIRGIDFPWPLAEMVIQHHERLDGSGYPNGLKRDEILLESRILAVADVVEAMASHRPYRAALGTDKALEEIERGRGTMYDENVVDACLKLFNEEGRMDSWKESVRRH